MYEYYNPNPSVSIVGDCVVRALSKALGKDWDTTYTELCLYGFSIKDMPSANRVWGRLLTDKGFKRHMVDYDMTVEQFCREYPEGCFVLAIEGHVVTEIDGTYFDSWDSKNEHVLFYWTR